jgi:1,4-alpha-glucan branching enzyme
MRYPSAEDMTRQAAEKRNVTFKVRAPRAKKVQLAGEFNDWDPNIHPMERDEDGFWKVRLRLAPGRYEYKLIVDGRWWEDIRKADSPLNPFGTRNRLLVVPQK